MAEQDAERNGKRDSCEKKSSVSRLTANENEWKIVECTVMNKINLGDI